MTGRIDELLAEFAEKTRPLGVAVHRVANSEAAADLIMQWEPVTGADTLLVADELTGRFPGLTDALRERGAQTVAPESLAHVRDAPVGLSLAQLAVAETGSALLAEATLGDRAIGMLTKAQVIVAPTETLVASLDEAAPVLRRLALSGASAMTTLVTGPSRTADIERVLTVGVQGPGIVMVVFIDSQ